MNATRFIRIALLLAAIFAAGVFTGRWTVPRLPTVVYTVPAKPGSPDAILARMTVQVGLDAEQQAKARPILEDYVAKMSRTPLGSPDRLDHFRHCTSQIRELMRPDQYDRYDRRVEAAYRFFERQLQQNSGK